MIFSRNLLVVLLTSGVVFLSCGSGEPSSSETPSEKTVKPEVYEYSHSNDSVLCGWTAFKHTAKTPVHGKFDSIEVMAKPASSMEEWLKSASLKTWVSSLNSGDVTRDPKIKEFFFGKMSNTDVLQGNVQSVDWSKKQAVVTLKMNNVEKETTMNIKTDESISQITLLGTIDVLDWNGEEAVSSLNEACDEKHTGDDGESKLWSEVDLSLSVKLNKESK